MKKGILLILLTMSFCGALTAQDQSTSFNSSDSLLYDLFGEAHALMCPFLSPQLQKKIEKEGGRSFIKTSDLHLIFKVPSSSPISTERIMQLVDKTGYESKNFRLTISNDNP